MFNFLELFHSKCFNNDCSKAIKDRNVKYKGSQMK